MKRLVTGEEFYVNVGVSKDEMLTVKGFLLETILWGSSCYPELGRIWLSAPRKILFHHVCSMPTLPALDGSCGDRAFVCQLCRKFCSTMSVRLGCPLFHLRYLVISRSAVAPDCSIKNFKLIVNSWWDTSPDPTPSTHRIRTFQFSLDFEWGAVTADVALRPPPWLASLLYEIVSTMQKTVTSCQLWSWNVWLNSPVQRSGNYESSKMEKWASNRQGETKFSAQLTTWNKWAKPIESSLIEWFRAGVL